MIYLDNAATTRVRPEAAQAAQQVMDQAQKDCEAMKQAARQRLDQAAQLIVEKVVNR